MTKYKVTLTSDERRELQERIAVGKAAAEKLIPTRILRNAAASEGGPGWSDRRIAAAVEVNGDTVTRVRERFVEPGLEAALVRKKQARPRRPGRSAVDRVGVFVGTGGACGLGHAVAGRPVGGVADRGVRLR